MPARQALGRVLGRQLVRAAGGVQVLVRAQLAAAARALLRALVPGAARTLTLTLTLTRDLTLALTLTLTRSPGPLAKEFHPDEQQPRYKHDPERFSLHARNINLKKTDVLMSDMCKSSDNQFVGISLYSPHYKAKAERLLRSCARVGVCCKVCGRGPLSSREPNPNPDPNSEYRHVQG